MSSSGPPVAKKRILVVDDEHDLVDLLVRLLSRRGYSVAAALNLADAAKELSAGRFDIIVSDIDLGSESGIDLFRWCEKNVGSRAQKFIFLSGTENLDAIEAELGESSGCTFLSKPMDIHMLISVVKNLCG